MPDIIARVVQTFSSLDSIPPGDFSTVPIWAGTGQDDASDLAVDSMAMRTSPEPAPVTFRSYRTTGSGGSFVVKLNPVGTALSYSTYLDSVRAEAYGIAVDKAGNTFVVGTTYSPEFPTTPGAIRRTPSPTTSSLPS